MNKIKIESEVNSALKTGKNNCWLFKNCTLDLQIFEKSIFDLS